MSSAQLSVQTKENEPEQARLQRHLAAAVWPSGVAVATMSARDLTSPDWDRRCFRPSSLLAPHYFAGCKMSCKIFVSLLKFCMHFRRCKILTSYQKFCKIGKAH